MNLIVGDSRCLVQELRGVHESCEVLQQSVARLKQKLALEEAKQADLAGLTLPSAANLAFRLCLLGLPSDFAQGLADCLHVHRGLGAERTPKGSSACLGRACFVHTADVDIHKRKGKSDILH